MRIDESKRYYISGGMGPSKVTRLWDDGDDSDELSHIVINDEHYRVEWFAKSTWSYASPPYCWIVTRLSESLISMARAGHNRREDCQTKNNGVWAWIIDEADSPDGTHKHDEWWEMRLLLETQILYPFKNRGSNA